MLAVVGLDDTLAVVETGNDDHTKAIHITRCGAAALVLNLRCWKRLEL